MMVLSSYTRITGFSVWYDRWHRSWRWRENPDSRWRKTDKDVRAAGGFAARSAAERSIRAELRRRGFDA